jgi:hypothetical protein
MFIYAFGFYTVQPELVMCKDLNGSSILLKQDFACDNLDLYVDCQAHFAASTSDTFHNWISQMDLVCS